MKAETQFSNHGDKLTLTAFDEDGDMTITISDKGRKSKAVYVLCMDDARQLAKVINQYIKLEKEANQ